MHLASATDTRRAFVATWVVRNGLAELGGIALAAAAAIGLARAFGEPDTLGERLLSYAAMLAAGAVEGLLLGLAQSTLLRRRLPGLSVRRFTLATVAVATLAWAVGMAAPTFGPASAPSAAPPEEPSFLLVAAVSAGGGALGGLLFALAQRVELRRHVASTRAWIGASVLGWALALPLDMVGATLPDATSSAETILLSAALFGLLAGAAYALPTAFVAFRMGAPQKAHDTTALAHDEPEVGAFV
ncbi:hypothetical protein [Polyangium sp. y55x31]|uniref:hypothetical protein n=1 Tax=Polyangium sp. y55x31 TaxID=3042688 RepID=UPI002482AB46|nr:hypothetical protein [Polyangium sp. y55x31]MDI1480347.1 hypothetical protein [Polyangium sp. y55x31]